MTTYIDYTWSLPRNTRVMLIQEITRCPVCKGRKIQTVTTTNPHTELKETSGFKCPYCDGSGLTTYLGKPEYAPIGLAAYIASDIAAASSESDGDA